MAKYSVFVGNKEIDFDLTKQEAYQVALDAEMSGAMDVEIVETSR